MIVIVAVSHAMFSARFDQGAMSAADRFIGCAGRTVVEAVAQASTNSTEKNKSYFLRPPSHRRWKAAITSTEAQIRAPLGGMVCWTVEDALNGCCMKRLTGHL